MYSIGTDIIDIARIKKCAENVRFMSRVFSKKELDLFTKKKDPYPSMAGNWAAKEAFSKALGTGIKGFSLNEISVLRDDSGKPFFELSGNALKISRNLYFSVSISHTDTLANAVVIAYKTTT